MQRPARIVALAAAVVHTVAAAGPLEPFRIDGDAIEAALGAHAGDARRGRDILAGRDGNCLLCHAVPETGARFMGNLGPPLSGIGGRLSAGQLRLRIVDPARVNPETIMPSYYRIEGLVRVAPAFSGRPVLDAQQIEDVVAFLQTLK